MILAKNLFGGKKFDQWHLLQLQFLILSMTYNIRKTV
jgi:hypothetical protein